MFKSVAKISAVAAATFVLAGCFTASSLNRDIQLPAQPAQADVMPAKAAPAAKEYTLSGDFLFDFDKSTLSAKGQETLNHIAQEIKTAGTHNVTVTGYTDRLGLAAYNLKLSQARANSAKSYLAAQGVKANIQAVGRGKANQVKACNTEQGEALKSYLKPNRRVVIKAE